jgi:hypothetical protein
LRGLRGTLRGLRWVEGPHGLWVREGVARDIAVRVVTKVVETAGIKGGVRVKRRGEPTQRARVKAIVSRARSLAQVDGLRWTIY